jgi:hypothetical protein
LFGNIRNYSAPWSGDGGAAGKNTPSQSGDRRRSPKQAKKKGEITGRKRIFFARLYVYSLTGPNC